MHAEGRAGFVIRVIVHGVGGHDHPATTRHDANDLQSLRMPTHMVHRNSWSYFRLAIVKGDPAAVKRSDERANLLDIKRPPEKWAADARTDGMLDFPRLEMKARVGKFFEIARVIPVQMSGDDVIE